MTDQTTHDEQEFVRETQHYFMPIRIIDETPDPEVAKRISCCHCGTKLEYFPIDVKERNGTDYGGGPDGETWIDCPKCGKKAIISTW